MYNRYCMYIGIKVMNNIGIVSSPYTYTQIRHSICSFSQQLLAANFCDWWCVEVLDMGHVKHCEPRVLWLLAHSLNPIINMLIVLHIDTRDQRAPTTQDAIYAHMPALQMLHVPLSAMAIASESTYHGTNWAENQGGGVGGIVGR